MTVTSRRLTLAAGFVALIVMVRVAYPRNLVGAYDTYYAMAWGRDLFGGSLPAFEILGASTPHPLTIGLEGLATTIGNAGAIEATRLLGCVLFAALVIGMYLLGEACLGPAAGIAAALLAGLNPQFLELTSGTADALYVTLVLFAVVLEVQRPRRGTAPLVLLALAGLARPEAWLLAAAYWVYAAPGWGPQRRAALAGLVAAPVIVWTGLDWASTGDPLFSLSATREGAQAAHRPTGLSAFLPQVSSGLRDTLDASDLVPAGIGIALATIQARHRLLVPAAVVALALLGFLALALAGLPLLPRYLLLPAMLLLVFAAHCLTGWVSVPASRVRTAGMMAAGAAAILLVVQLQGRVDSARALAHEQQARLRIDDDFRQLLDTTRVRRHRCGNLSVASFAMVPAVAFHGHVEPRTIRILPAADRRTLTIVPVTPDVARRYFLPKISPQHYGRVVARTASWAAVTRGC